MKKLRLWPFLAVALLVPVLALAGGKHSYLSGKALNHIFRTTSFTAPSTVYVGLFSVCPGAATNGTELSGNGYQRGHFNGTSVVGIAKGDGSWTETSNTYTNAWTIKNTSKIDFPAAQTASWSVACFGIFDASTGGNLLYWGSVTGSPTVNVGATASFNALDLVITEQ